MPLTQQSTYKATVADTDAITLTWNGRTYALAHAQAALLTPEQIELALRSLATPDGQTLPEVHIHRNVGGSLAFLIGPMPIGFLWPEEDDGGEREGP